MSPTDQTAGPLPQRLALAFQPLHKRAFGVAIGTAGGLLVALATVIILIGDGAELNLGLLRQYFAGYSVSPGGVLVGFFWGFVTGFVAARVVSSGRSRSSAMFRSALVMPMPDA